MVRLQQCIFFRYTTSVKKAQFHYGSITTKKRKNVVSLHTELNSTMVRLQQNSNISLSPFLLSSIPLWFDYNFKTSFKPNDGSVSSIPLWFDYNLWCRIWPYTVIHKLNSTMVRLQQIKKIIEILERHKVSIPLWFDYNLKRISYLFIMFRKVSIPLWFDYNKLMRVY